MPLGRDWPSARRRVYGRVASPIQRYRIPAGGCATQKFVHPFNNPIGGQFAPVPIAIVIRTDAARGRVETHLAGGQLDVENPIMKFLRRVLAPAPDDAERSAVLGQCRAEVLERPVL